MKYILVTFRLISIIVFTSIALLALLLTILIKGNSNALGQKYGQFWGKVTANILGLKVKITGDIPKGRCLIIANHRSYSDIMLIYGQTACAFVAMAEAHSWPLIGIAAEKVGTIFVDRKSPNSRKETLIQMKKRLLEGFSIVLFPEGGTFGGPLTNTFKIGSFALAAENNIPIIPTAIEYQHVTDAWVDNISMIGHFVKTFGRWRTVASLHFGEALLETDANIFLAKTQAAVNQSLTEMRKDFDK